MASSIVSFYKREVREFLPGLQVAEYVVPPYEGKNPSIIHVTDTYYFKLDSDGITQTQVHIPSAELANAVVSMCISSQLANLVEPPTHPAIFWLKDEVDAKTVNLTMKDKVAEVLAAQRRWYIALVKIADDDWQTNHKHVMISDIQRMAARELGFAREWLLDEYTTQDDTNCPFCASKLLNPNAPICPNCGRTHNPAKLAELEARMAALISKPS
jgi:hypothetical protein